MHQILGKQVRIISKKEEDKDVSGSLSVLSVVVSTNELFVSRKPSSKPNLLAWEVLNSETTHGAVKFKNVQTGTYLTSSLPHYNVHATEDAGAESDWLLFSKSGATLLPFTADFVALGDVWIQNATTKGFLSVRSNEGMRCWFGCSFRFVFILLICVVFLPFAESLTRLDCARQGVDAWHRAGAGWCFQLGKISYSGTNQIGGRRQF
jgi:hypothetical protein